MNQNYCLGELCTDKRCEICPAAHSRCLDVTDSFRAHACVSPSGYYSSGGLIRVKNPKTGEIEIKYARNSGD